VTLKRFVPLVVLALALVACGDDDANPTTTTTTVSGGRVAVGDPISVEEAIAAPADRPHLVRGYLFVYADGRMVIADAIAESFPPQPGGATLEVEGFSVEGMTGFTDGPEGHELAQWSDEPVEILGTVADGVLTYYDNPTA
jgi:hypothetical protein